MTDVNGHLDNNIPPFTPSPALRELLARMIIVFFILGRGSKGKSTFARWLIHVLTGLHMPITIGDGDRTNATLASFFPEAVTPHEPDDATVIRWTYDKLEELSRNVSPHTLMLDYGGGDRAMARITHQLPLNDLLIEDLRVAPVAIHLVGHDPDDLAYIEALEEEERFAPELTFVIVNEGTIPEHISFKEVWDALVNTPTVQAIQRRGGMVLTMPPLGPALPIIQRRLSFADAIAGKEKATEESDKPLGPLGPTDRRVTRVWLEQMRVAMKPLLDRVLPGA